MASSRRRGSNAPDPLAGVEDIWSKVQTTASSGTAADPASAAETKDGEAAAAPSAPTSHAEHLETYTLFVGQRQAGKSSLITAFHNPSKDDTPKPTVALEYLFARRSSAPNQPKDVAHIWELGGGARLRNLVSVPITPQNIAHNVAAIVVDLSKPENLVSDLCEWIGIVRARVDECVASLRQTNLATANALSESASLRIPADHADARIVDPLAIPLLIIANKYDIYKDMESVQKKTICQALRFIAHSNGATLLTVGARDKASQNNLRMQLTQLLFRTSSSKKVELTNHDKPMVVPAGSDSYENIFKSLPKGTDTTDFIGARSVNSEANVTWERVMEDMFGPKRPTDEADGEEKKEDDAFVEPAVDEMRAQRDAALAQYKKEAERKLQLEISGKKSSSRSKSKSKSSSSSRK